MTSREGLVIHARLSQPEPRFSLGSFESSQRQRRPTIHTKDKCLHDNGKQRATSAGILNKYEHHELQLLGP